MPMRRVCRGFHPTQVARAAGALHAARRIWIAGFRSCHSVAELLNYQLRLFRPDGVQLVGGSGPEDLDFGAFRSGDAVIVISYQLYATSSVLSARAARSANASLISIADCANGADGGRGRTLLLFEAASSPGFFPSLTGAIAIAQSLAAVTFSLGGAGGRSGAKERSFVCRQCRNML